MEDPWQAERMDDLSRFRDEVREIVEWEDRIRTAPNHMSRTAPEHMIGTAYLEDRIKEQYARWKMLKLLWPIIRGNGSMRFHYPLDESKE